MYTKNSYPAVSIFITKSQNTKDLNWLGKQETAFPFSDVRDGVPLGIHIFNKGFHPISTVNTLTLAVKILDWLILAP